jgi:glycosyltransferase involved in cell wall biosynthesis
MKIGLITYPIERSPAGVGIYTLNLVEHILRLDSENTYYLLHYARNPHPIYARNEILYTHFKRLPVMFSDSWHLARHPAAFDVVHRFAPGGFLFQTRCKRIVTVYDLFMYKQYPFNRKLKIYLARYFNRNSIRHADAVVTISKYSKQEILKTFRIDERKVHVVYPGPGSFSEDSNTGEYGLHSTYDLKRGFILFVSTIEPRKNLLSLVKAYEVLKSRHGIEEDLVVIGRKGWDYGETLEYIERSAVRDSIRLLGFVPVSDLGRFYRNARLFVYPSHMEGFGIPPLEAMHHGCPVLTSNTSSLPEVVGQEEMMFAPTDIADLVSKCLRILRDANVRRSNINNCKQNLKKFTWENSARQTIQIYASLGRIDSGGRSAH